MLLVLAAAGMLLAAHELLHRLLHGKSVAAVLLSAGAHSPPWMIAAVLAFVAVRMAVALLPALLAAIGVLSLLRFRSHEQGRPATTRTP